MISAIGGDGKAGFCPVSLAESSRLSGNGALTTLVLQAADPLSMPLSAKLKSTLIKEQERKRLESRESEGIPRWNCWVTVQHSYSVKSHEKMILKLFLVEWLTLKASFLNTQTSYAHWITRMSKWTIGCWFRDSLIKFYLNSIFKFCVRHQKYLLLWARVIES